MLQHLRGFFAARGVLEVETPLLSTAAATDPALASLSTHWSGSQQPTAQRLYLHTSPELPMKRLLAAGSGPIYQVCKVFRDGERGRRHHPEFSLLEWYRPGWTLDALIDEVAELARLLLAQPGLGLRSSVTRTCFRSTSGWIPGQRMARRCKRSPWRLDSAVALDSAAARTSSWIVMVGSIC